MWLQGPHIVKWVEVMVLYHKKFTVLLKKEPHLSPGGRISEQDRILRDFVEIEEFEGLQRPPDFLPAPRKVRTIKDVHQGPLRTRDSNLHTGALCGRNAETLFPCAAKRMRKLRSPENMGAEHQRPQRVGCRVCEVFLGRVSPLVKLKRCVVRQYRIRGHLRGYEERVNRIGIGVGLCRDDCMQPAPYPNDTSGFVVAGQESLLGSSADHTMGRQIPGQLISGENGVFAEKFTMLHYWRS